VEGTVPGGITEPFVLDAEKKYTWLGIQEGDTIALETDWGRRAEARADLREGVHPEVVACVGVLGRQITGDPRIRGKGVHYNALIKFSPDMMDYVSAALDACVRVKVEKVSGPR